MSDKPVHNFVPKDATSAHAQSGHDGMAHFVAEINKPPAKAEGAMASMIRSADDGVAQLAGDRSAFGKPMPPKVETLDTDTSKLYAA